MSGSRASRPSTAKCRLPRVCRAHTRDWCEEPMSRMSRRTTDPIDELLIAAVRMDDPAGAHLSHALEAAVDWDKLTARAVRHRVMPLLCRRLKALGDSRVPRTWLAGLWRSYLYNEASVLRRIRALLPLFEALRTRDVPIVVFKGPALAQLYGGTGMRQYDDLDVLVRPRDFEHAVALVREHGFRPTFDPSPRQLRELIDYHGELPFRGASGSLSLDLHCRLVEHAVSPRFAAHDWLATSRPFDLEGALVRALGPAETLLMSCFHGVKHGWPTISSAVDVAMVMEAEGEKLEWASVVGLAAKTGMQGFLREGLLVAHTVTGVALPDLSLGSQEAARRTADRLPAEPGTDLSMLQTATGLLGALPSTQARLHYVFERLFRPAVNDWLSLRLPDRLYPLYAVLRPFRLATTRVLVDTARYRPASGRRQAARTS
ncbi:MAG: hypothetical protein GF331_12290 [Chitinivibrionales bacterium]|nr:hypothetical protein [Chitinivibrionales bacterium]